MKLILALFFSLQIITNNAFVEDIARIPSLIHHYEHHQHEETPGITFLDFIAMHYTTNAADDTDADHHSLPLKHANDAGHVHLIPAFTIPESQSGLSVVYTEVEHFTYFPEFIPNHNLDAIFQPPKTSVLS